MRLKDDTISRMDPTLLLVEEGFNVRMERPELEEHLAWLKASIREQGVQEPLVVRTEGEQVVVVNGHNRLRAVRELMREGVEFPRGIPCIAEGASTTPILRTLRILTGNGGLPLTALEKGVVFKRLIAMGVPMATIATQAGYSIRQVQNLILLEDSPEEVKDAVRGGTVSATEAIKAVRKHGDEAPKAIKKGADESPVGRATAKTMGRVHTRKRSEEMVATLEAVLEVDDVETIHTMVRDCLAVFNE